MLDKLEDVAKRFDEITDRLSFPDLSPKDIQELGKERARLEPVVAAFAELKKLTAELAGNKQMLADESDEELRALAKEEVVRLEPAVAALQDKLRVLLLPRDPLDDKDVILEIRAGTGGDEAALFAGELFHMYGRYAATQGWKVDVLSSSEGGRGGFKEVVASISGDQVYSKMKQEAGVHRVQRVPETEAQGRIHTSAVTVAVLPEAEEIDVKIEEKDLRVDVFRSGGPGGQSVNTTDSAVRITHLPTNTVVICQDEKSQLKNKNKAMKVLRARLYDKQIEEQNAKLAAERKQMVKSGDRSDKIRTYNFPQDRVTDHRVGCTVHNLPKILQGDLDGFLSQVRSALQAERLKESGEAA